MDDGHVRNWVMVRTKVSEGVPKRTALCSFLFGREEGMGSSEGGVQICSGRVERRDGVIAWVRWSAVVLLCPHPSTTLVVASGLADFSGDLHPVIRYHFKHAWDFSAKI